MDRLDQKNIFREARLRIKLHFSKILCRRLLSVDFLQNQTTYAPIPNFSRNQCSSESLKDKSLSINHIPAKENLFLRHEMPFCEFVKIWRRCLAGQMGLIQNILPLRADILDQCFIYGFGPISSAVPVKRRLEKNQFNWL